MMKRHLFIKACLALIAFCFFTQGCVKANFTEPITTFQESINKSASAIGTYYTNLNKFERKLYLEERLFDPKKKVLVTDEKGKPTPLLYQVFSPVGIKARMDSIVLLGIYANRLGTLAGSTAPSDFRGAVEKLGTNLDQLKTSFETLASKGDPSAGNYAGPVSKIVGIIGQHIIEEKREKLLEMAIIEGSPAVEEILEQLEKDLVNIIQPLQTTGLKIALANRVMAYNDRVEKYLVELHEYAKASKKTSQPLVKLKNLFGILMSAKTIAGCPKGS
jgi:hypothetical protein